MRHRWGRGAGSRHHSWESFAGSSFTECLWIPSWLTFLYFSHIFVHIFSCFINNNGRETRGTDPRGKPVEMLSRARPRVGHLRPLGSPVLAQPESKQMLPVILGPRQLFSCPLVPAHSCQCGRHPAALRNSQLLVFCYFFNLLLYFFLPPSS